MLFNNTEINLQNYHCSIARIFNVKDINAVQNSPRNKFKQYSIGQIKIVRV